jgi:molybdopterin molybdotransferase
MAVTFEEARSLILENVAPLTTERVQLLAAVGRILAEDFRAPWDLPGWDNSAMDGYAVRAEDCCNPVTLAVVDYLPAGGSAEGMVVRPGTAVKIMTGAPVPQGCTAVVPFEAAAEEGDRVHIRERVEPRSHIRFRGEDLRAGDLVIPAGTVLRPPEINMLAAFGQAQVAVYRRPRVPFSPPAMSWWNSANRSRRAKSSTATPTPWRPQSWMRGESRSSSASPGTTGRVTRRSSVRDLRPTC